MNNLRMRSGISHRSFSGCAIILDIDRDRYWKVDARTAMALDWITGRQRGPVDPGQFTRLEQLGLIGPPAADGQTVQPHDPPAPQASLIEGDAPKRGFHLPDAIEVAYLTFAARRALRRQSLRSILTDVERSRTTTTSSSEAADLARGFDRYRRLVPVAKQCLPDTLAFLRFAGRRRCFPSLVFGVEAWPFAAHCWAQSGNVVLNDALDHARAFSPILTI